MSRRRKIDLAELIDEPWVMTPPDSANYAGLEEAFRVRGLNVPKASLITDSVPLRANLVANGPYLSVFTTSGLRSNADHAALRELPVELPRPNPIGIITLKKRTLSPVVERFIECARKVAKSREKVK